MKTILTLAILAVLITAVVPQAVRSGQVVDILEEPLVPSLPSEYLDLLPSGYEIPTRLPATITDPHLLLAWVYLYNQTNPITVHDGSTLTGRSLAEYVIANAVPVVWGSANRCGGNSCTPRFACKTLACLQGYVSDEVYTVYVSPRFKDTSQYTLARFAGSLAHELYHHTRPFGPVDTNMYEEYWAFYVGAQIEGATWAIFTGYDPNISACLQAWFRSHNKRSYLDNDLYPLAHHLTVDLESEVCYR